MAATLQRKSSGGIIFVIITKSITKENVLSRTLKSTQIRGVPKSEFSGSQKWGSKGGGEEGRSGGRVNRA